MYRLLRNLKNTQEKGLAGQRDGRKKNPETLNIVAWLGMFTESFFWCVFYNDGDPLLPKQFFGGGGTSSSADGHGDPENKWPLHNFLCHFIWYTYQQRSTLPLLHTYYIVAILYAVLVWSWCYESTSKKEWKENDDGGQHQSTAE